MVRLAEWVDRLARSVAADGTRLLTLWAPVEWLSMETMDKFIEVADLGDVPPGCALAVETDFGAIALFNADGLIFAVAEYCLRCGASLVRGRLVGFELTCMDCRWHYDLVTSAVRGVAKLWLDAFEIEIREGKVFVAAQFKPPSPRCNG